MKLNSYYRLIIHNGNGLGKDKVYFCFTDGLHGVRFLIGKYKEWCLIFDTEFEFTIDYFRKEE